MNTKHTPGPWKTRKGFDSDTIEVFAPNPKIEMPFQPTELAVVQADSREGKANARLISASSCMAEAITNHLNPLFDRQKAHEQLIAALAKALGKEPA